MGPTPTVCLLLLVLVSLTKDAVPLTAALTHPYLLYHSRHDRSREGSGKARKNAWAAACGPAGPTPNGTYGGPAGTRNGATGLWLVKLLLNFQNAARRTG